MKNIITSTLIFCFVLFIYVHIHFHIKTSNDLEIYEIEQPSKEKLEEICDLRQPVIFHFENNSILNNCNNNNLLQIYDAFDIKIRNLKDTDFNQELYIPLTLKNSINVINEDNDSKYLIEKNNEFIEETGLIKCFKYNDIFLRPFMVSNSFYDYMLASNNATTPFRYNIDYRNYFYVTEGSVHIKLAPPKNSRYLYQVKDYENFEFRSPVNPWNVQPQYKPDFDKIKCLEVEVNKGNIIHIPAYWWYSIKFNKNTSVTSFRYRTYMNNIAILPHIVTSLLQGQNIKRNYTNKSNNTLPTESVKFEPTNVESVKLEPTNVESVKLEPTNVESVKLEPTNVDLSNV